VHPLKARLAAGGRHRRSLVSLGFNAYLMSEQMDMKTKKTTRRHAELVSASIALTTDSDMRRNDGLWFCFMRVAF
jgi:hypothetical protein